MPLADAYVITKVYRETNLNSQIGRFLDKDFVIAILNHAECAGLNYYVGRFPRIIHAATH